MILKEKLANTKGSVTHMYGGVCDMERIMNIANEKYLRSRRLCSMSYGRLRWETGWDPWRCWKLSLKLKQLTCGDGGILTCDDEN